MIRVLLVDDHSLFRESLGRLLEAEGGMQVVGTCQTPAEAVSILHTTPVDLVLLDHDLGEQQSTAFFALAKQSFNGRVLLVTAGMSETEALRALETGASGLFLKHSPPGQLIEAIHQVMAGETWIDPKAVRALESARNEAEKNEPAKPAVLPLTAREQAVLKGIFEGLANKEIAARLQISESSVKAGVQQLFDKTGVRTRSQLVRIALERHLDQ